MNISFKNWFLQEEENAIELGQKREPKLSGFCLHNPKINQFAKENSTQMFIVFAFVFYTIQKEWQIVHHTFPEFLKWLFEEAIPQDNWNYEHKPFHKFANLLAPSNDPQYANASYLQELWPKKNEIYSNIMALDKSSSSSLSDSSEFEIYKYIINNIRGLALAKAAFATQLILGKFGCIDSVNTAAYDALIRKDIEQKGDKSAFTLQTRKVKKRPVLDAEGKEIQDAVIKKASGVSMRGYIDFLKALQDLYGDDISKILWNDWCEIVGQKVVKAGTGKKITLKVNNQEFQINPYRPKSNLATLLQKEKENLSLVDPESTGTGISLGHLDAIRAGQQYRTPQIKALESSYADMAMHMGADVESLHHLMHDFISNLSLKNAYESMIGDKKVRTVLKGADFVVGFSKMKELFGSKIASALAIYEMFKGLASGDQQYKNLGTISKFLREMLSIAKDTAKNPILGPAAVGAGAYGLGFDDFIEIAGKFKFGSLLYFYVSQIIDAMKHGDEAQKIADAVKVKVKNLLGI